MFPDGVQIPTVGRIVHYQAYGTPGGEFKSVPRAAIVTDVFPETGRVGVCVLNPQGIFFNTVDLTIDPVPGCANWPPRIG